MANYFQHSDNLSVFPSAYRVFDGGSKFTSEKNIANLMRALISTNKDPSKDKDSFVVGDIGNNRFAVIVRGYYFEWDLAFNNGKHDLRVKLVNIQSGYLVTEGGSTILDDSDQFLALEYIEDDKSSDQNYLQVILNDEVVNTGYIPGLMDKNGNWIDLRLILDSETNYTTINQQSINFNTDSILPTYVEGASKLIDATTLDDIDEGNVDRPIYFKDGLPVHIGDGTNSIGSLTKPVYVDKDGFIKPVSYTLAASVNSSGSGADGKLAYYMSGAVAPFTNDQGGTVGSTTKPIYILNGKPTPIDKDISDTAIIGGSGSQNKIAYYSDNNTVKAFTSIVGDNTKDAIKPIWLNNGVPSIFSQSSGSNTNGVYINSYGQIVPMSYELKATVYNGTANKLAYYSSANSISSYTATTADIGKRGLVSQSMYLHQGALTGGQQITVSTSAPGSSSGSAGDLWFQI